MSELATNIEQAWRRSDGTDFAGTLELPAWSPSAPPPAVLLISGSGPLDRDSNTPDQRLDIAKALAEYLATVGIASLRFDKRGTGSSGGDYAMTGFDAEYSDAAGALRHLASLDQVDPNRIAVVGHSVGATMAIRLAAAEPTVAAAVLLAAAASPGETVLEWQSDRIGQTLPGPNWLTGRLFRMIQRRSRAKLNKPNTRSSARGKAPVSGQWLREYAAYDPADDLPRLTCPVLAVTGAKDLQVNPADLASIAELVTGPCRTEAPANLTHLLRSTAARHSISQYRKLMDKPVDPSLLSLVGTWLKATLDPN